MNVFFKAIKIGLETTIGFFTGETQRQNDKINADAEYFDFLSDQVDSYEFKE